MLDDDAVADREAVRRILLCTGKVYYDLAVEREKRKSAETALVRVEQLYPYPEWNLAQVFASYPRAQAVYWVQEEPQNMGAWNFVRNRLVQTLPFGRSVRYAGRPESASPATGSLLAHRKQQAALIGMAFD